MDPELFRVFVGEFAAEWNRLQAEAGAGRAAQEAELEKVRRQIERLIDALADGTLPAASVRDRLADLEQRRVALENRLAAAPVPAPRLHPNVAEVYREKVAALAEVLTREDAAAAREAVRRLVEAIILVPENGSLRVEIRGELAAILALSSAAGSRRGDRAAETDAMVLAEQVKLVAGTGFEPVTFRL
jgi:site-specific DNA recombinase